VILEFQIPGASETMAYPFGGDEGMGIPGYSNLVTKLSQTLLRLNKRNVRSQIMLIKIF